VDAFGTLVLAVAAVTAGVLDVIHADRSPGVDQGHSVPGNASLRPGLP
jgi:hypothetical protein